MFFGKKKKTSNIDIGKYGENLASDFLRSNGYFILERNYRRKFGEVDIIAQHGDTLVFVEVKTRKSQKYGTGFEAVNFKKQQQLSRIAQDYICRNNKHDFCARFDVISIIIPNNQQPQIDMIQNAFELVE